MFAAARMRWRPPPRAAERPMPRRHTQPRRAPCNPRFVNRYAQRLHRLPGMSAGGLEEQCALLHELFPRLSLHALHQALRESGSIETAVEQLLQVGGWDVGVAQTTAFVPPPLPAATGRRVSPAA